MNLIRYSFICCIWNEIDRAPREFQKLIDVISDSNLRSSVEVLLIDNDSSDGTSEWMRSLVCPKVNIKKIYNSSNIVAFF